MQQKNSRLEMALAYRERGFGVIPLKEHGKKPAVKWEKYQTQQAIEEELRQWFSNDSRYNVGIVTGKISNLIVIDLDSEEAIKFAEKHLPKTPTVKTAKGLHLYYCYKENITNSVRFGGIPLDVCGDGGCVAAPPSIHESGIQYEWVIGLDKVPLADFPEAILNDQLPQKTRPLKNLYSGVEQGSRNDSLARLAGSMANDRATYKECLRNCLAINRTYNPPLPEKEVETIVGSIYKRHQSIPESFKKKGKGKSDQPPMLAVFPGLIDLVDNDGKVSYLVCDNDGLKIVSEHNLDGQVYIPPEKNICRAFCCPD